MLKAMFGQWIPFQSLISVIMLVSRKEFLEVQAISEWRFTQYCYVAWQIHQSVFSSLQYSIVNDKIGKINTLKKIMFFSCFFTISKIHFFAYGFSKKKYKKAKFPHWMKEIFFAKKKKKKRKWRKEKKIKVRIEIFQDYKKERNLKAINSQKLLYAN